MGGTVRVHPRADREALPMQACYYCCLQFRRYYLRCSSYVSEVPNSSGASSLQGSAEVEEVGPASSGDVDRKYVAAHVAPVDSEYATDS